MNTPLRRVMVMLAAALLAVAGCGVPVKQELDVVYGEADGQKLMVDVFMPAMEAKGPRAAIVAIHGGAWRAGDRKECHDLAKGLAGQGYVVFAVGYRLARPDGNHWPAQLDDVQRAVRWVKANASRFGIDPERVGAAGGSAGGHLAACLGTQDTRDNSDKALAGYSSRVKCVINMVGPTDLTDDFGPKVKDGPWTNEQIEVLLGGKVKDLPELARSASPLLLVDAKTAPTLLVFGRKDPLVPLDHGVRYDAALKKAGVDSRLFIHNGGHGLDDAAALVPFLAELDAFLKKHLAP